MGLTATTVISQSFSDFIIAESRIIHAMALLIVVHFDNVLCIV